MYKESKILNLIFDEGASEGEILNGVKLLRKSYKEGKLFNSEKELKECHIQLERFMLLSETRKRRIIMLEDFLRDEKDKLNKKMGNIEEQAKRIKELENSLKYRNLFILYIFIIGGVIGLFVHRHWHLFYI